MNRSEEIRRFYDKNPGARPKECIAALAAQGIDVSPTLVSCVRAKLKVRDMGADVALVGDFVDSSGLDPEVAVEILRRFADVVDGVGGIPRFREVLLSFDPKRVVGGMDEDEDVSSDAPVPVSAPAPAPTPVAEDVPVVESLYEDVNDEDEDD
jgi:hypothetical protein